MSVAEPPIFCERDGALAMLALNNPEKINAFSQAMRDALTAALAALNAAPEVRAIILKGMGENFSAGADMGGWYAAGPAPKSAP